jgi:hypothetical protein
MDGLARPLLNVTGQAHRTSSGFVMPDLALAIHVGAIRKKDVDGRVKPGHDEILDTMRWLDLPDPANGSATGPACARCGIAMSKFRLDRPRPEC